MAKKRKPAGRKPTKKRKGRPAKFDDAKLRRLVVKVLKEGGSLKDAAIMARVDHTTLNRRMRTDPAFRADIEWAVTDGKLKHVKNVKVAGDAGEWRASAWFLDRKFGEEWGRRDNDSISLKQFHAATEQLVLAVLDEIPPEYHERIQRRMAAIASVARSGSTQVEESEQLTGN